MPVVWNPNKLWDSGMSEDEKKEIHSMFTEDLKQCVGSIQLSGGRGIITLCNRKLYMNFLV